MQGSKVLLETWKGPEEVGEGSPAVLWGWGVWRGTMPAGGTTSQSSCSGSEQGTRPK